MISFWQHLSWSHAALVLLVVLLLLGLIASLIGKCMAINEEPPRPQGDLDVRDYSREYQEKLDWLGDDFLCAKPVNRIAPRGAAQ